MTKKLFSKTWRKTTIEQQKEEKEWNNVLNYIIPPLHYPKSIHSCDTLRNAPQQTTEGLEWYWREAVIHETGYLSSS